MTQLSLFEWADAKPGNVINLVPALIDKAVMETIYNVPRPKGGYVIPMKRKVA